MGLEDIRVQLSVLPDPKQCIDTIFRLKTEQQSLVAFLLNNWWWERNKVREGEARREQQELAWITMQQHVEFRNLDKPPQTEQQGQRQSTWSRPMNGMLKLNVDGGFSKEKRQGSWGYVIRYNEGEVIQAGKGKILHVLDAWHTELMACINGVKAAQSMGIHNFILETDALLTKQALQGGGFRLSLLGGLIHELKELLTEEFSAIQISHVPRRCNKVAHELARLGSYCQEDVVFVPGTLPDFVHVLVTSDLTGSQG